MIFFRFEFKLRKKKKNEFSESFEILKFILLLKAKMWGNILTTARNFLFIGLFSTIGSFLVYKSIWTYGPLVSPDSAVYLQTAENFKNGYGISVRDADGFKVMTHWAPLYPIILSFFDDFRILNVLLAFITSFIFGAIILDATRSIYASILSAILLSISPTYVLIFSYLWSETLSLPFVLLTLSLIKKYLDRQSFYLLFIFSILISISTLIRYANLFFILVIVAIFFVYRLPIRHLLLSLAISSSLFVLWQLRNISAPNPQFTTRELSLHLPSIHHFYTLFSTLIGYILPEKDTLLSNIYIPPEKGFTLSKYFQNWSFIVAFSFILGIVVFLSKKEGKLEISNWEKLLLICSVCYIVFIFTSISIYDYTTPPDTRILSPLFLFLVIFSFVFIYKILNFKLRGALIYLVLTISYLNYELSYFQNIKENPRLHFLNKTSLLNLEIIKEIKDLPKDAYIYTNDPFLVYFGAKRFSSMMPLKFNPVANKPDKNFQDKIKDMYMKLKQKDGFLVIFYPFNPPYIPTREELENLLPLKVYKETKSGIIYKVRE